MVEKREPRRLKLRRLSAEPRLTMSSMDTEDPKRIAENSDVEDPSFANARSEIVEPRCRKSMMLTSPSPCHGRRDHGVSQTLCRRPSVLEAMAALL